MSQIQISNGEILTNEVELKKLSKTIRAKEINVKVKNLIKETLYNSAAQAIIKIIETPYYTLKIFLFICLIASSGICSYLFISS